MKKKDEKILKVHALKHHLFLALRDYEKEKVAEWMGLIEKGERWVCQYDGVPVWWVAMSAAAASRAVGGRAAGVPPASARAYLWQMVREAKISTTDSIGEGYPTTLFYIPDKKEE